MFSISSFYLSKMVKLTVFLLLIVLLGAIFWWLQQVGEEKELKGLELVLKRPAIEKRIGHVWRWGDSDNLWKKGALQCASLPLSSDTINSQFLRCNPLFFQCLLSAKTSYLEIEEHEFLLATYENGNVFRLDAQKNGYWIRYFLGKHSSMAYEVFVENSCFEKRLPPGIYGYGVLNKKSDWVWDNLDYNILFDSEFVTNFAVAQWKKSSHKVLAKEWFRPAVNLGFKEMEQFCFDHGKELLNARVLDAASAYVLTTPKRGDKYISRSAYPWRGREKNNFLYIAGHDESFEFNKEYCKKIYTKECLEYGGLDIFFRRATSLSGMNNTLGGYPEAVKNKRFPKSNLRASSFLFSIKSSWHQIGKRVQWNGMIGDKSNITWMDEKSIYGDLPSEQNVPIAFRCMRIGKRK